MVEGPLDFGQLIAIEIAQHVCRGIHLPRDTAHILNAIPLLQELNKVFQAKDYKGQAVPVADRISKALTGMPRLYQGGFGGRMETDVLQTRRRLINTWTREIGMSRRRLKTRRKQGTLTAQIEASIRDHLKMKRAERRRIRRSVR